MHKGFRDIEEIKIHLKTKGYKLTNQRECILNVILENVDKHLTIDEIYDFVCKINKSVGIATVYRTVMLFQELGIIVKLNLDDRHTRYELASIDGMHNHHHLICLKCSCIIEVNEDLLEELEKQVEGKYSFKILDHNLKILGICCKCQKQ